MAAFIIEHDSALSAWGQIQRDLRHRLDGGEFAAGERIQPEVQLSEYYGVSRVTIRRSIRALIDDGYLRARRGSGTFVTDRTVALVCELDLMRPWKEQLLIDGHSAESQMIETADNATLPPEIAHTFGRRIPVSPLTFTRNVHAVDGIPIGVTESWRTALGVVALTPAPAEGGLVATGGWGGSGSEAMVAECFAEIGFATALHAELLHSYLDIPLIVVIARSHFAATGEIAEYARTSWLASRVRLAYQRHLTVAEIDVAPPIAAPQSMTAPPL